ncbi:hypothetical protein H6P81_000012 [Aristolochia fimbriata]|uniref:Uncharacterized protein n=1 Tax=Aristolochia fimbriata TaxID=158543 RepID=A0AAV7F3M3_ARIFI|nr:hypothetical protein H6P81_000012 [Aristolochia fimbriata]
MHHLCPRSRRHPSLSRGFAACQALLSSLSVSVGPAGAFAVGVLSDLYTFHRSTGNSLCPYRTPAWWFPPPVRVEPWDLTADLKNHLQTLYAQSFRITLASSVLPRLLAGVSRCLFLRYRHCFFSEKKFTTRGPSTSTRHCSVRLSPIAENSPLLPPVGVWAVSQSQCG